MAKRVTVDSSYQPVPESSPEAAYVFDADDARLEKYQRSARDANRLAGRTVPADVAAEAVGTERKNK